MTGPSTALLRRPSSSGERAVHVERLGTASDVACIAIHGGPGFTGDTMRSGMTALAAHRPVTLFDLPGCGRSSRHRGSGYPFDAYLDDLDAVIAWTGAAHVVLVAHGWGGILACAAARRPTPRIAGLVLVNPLRVLDETGQDEVAQHRRIDAIDPSLVPRFRALAPLVARARAGDADAFDAFDRESWPREMFATQFAQPAPRAWVDAVRDAALGYESYDAYKGRALADPDATPWGRFDLCTWARDVACPALVVASDDDANYVAPPDRHARPLVACMSDATLVVEPGVGHFPFAEDPDGFARRVDAWIAEKIR